MTEIEQRLIEAARNGTWLECSEPDDVVPAELIRELLAGRHGSLDRNGVRLTHARLVGALNLDMVEATAGLHLVDCVIDEPIEARQASLPYLILQGGRCTGFYADGIRVGVRLFLRGGLRVTGDNEDGAIRLISAHVVGRVEMTDLEIDNATGPALLADGLRVDGDLLLRRGPRIRGHHQQGAIRLIGAHVAGKVEITGVEITNAVGPALNATNLHVDGYLQIKDDVRVTGGGELGAIRLLGAHVRSNLEMAGVALDNATGPALQVDGLRVDGRMHLGRGIHITGHHEHGAVSLLGARVAGGLDLTAVQITNAAGPALTAGGLHVEGSLILQGHSRFAGHGELGAIHLLGADITKNLDLEDVEVTNTVGPAIQACHMNVGGSLYVRDGVRLSGDDQDGAFDLAGTRVGDQFRGRASVIVEAGSGLVLNLHETSVGRMVGLPPGLVCLDRARSSTCWHLRWVRLDEFSFASLDPRWDWQQWLHVIRCHTPAYHASSYQRLAAVERAAGHDGTVRRILMAQQTDLRRRSPESLGGPLTRWFHWLWGVLAGYGYRARRTAAALLLVLAVAGAIGWWAGQVAARPGHLVAERVSTATAATGTPCSTVELIGLGLDRGLPLAMTGMRARCDLDTASRAGQAFTAAIWLVQLAVWGLATLALAGYTNLVRKPG